MYDLYDDVIRLHLTQRLAIACASFDLLNNRFVALFCGLDQVPLILFTEHFSGKHCNGNTDPAYTGVTITYPRLAESCCNSLRKISSRCLIELYTRHL